MAPLAMSREAMRRAADLVSGMIVDHHARRGESEGSWPTPTKEAAPRQAERLRPREEGAELEVVLAEVEAILASDLSTDSPYFQAMIPSAATFVSVLGDYIASGYNRFCGVQRVSPGARGVEAAVIRWFCELAGLPAAAGGVLTSGGSAASLIAFAAARRTCEEAHRGVSLDRYRAYCGDLTHPVNLRNLRVIGLQRPEQAARIPTTAAGSISAANLAAQILVDRARGLRPFLIIANAGCTDTGTIDPIDEIVEIAEREGLWVHVDASYGGAAMLLEEERWRLRGIERADTIAIDPHKWFFQPYEIGAILAREPGLLASAFSIDAPYFRDVQGECEYKDLGIQLSRSFRALKLWLSLRVFGVAGFRDAVRRGVENARTFAELMRGIAGCEVIQESLGVVLYRFVLEGAPSQQVDALNRRIAGLAWERTPGLLNGTCFRGVHCLRSCLINPAIDSEVLTRTARMIERLAEEAALAAGDR